MTAGRTAIRGVAWNGAARATTIGTTFFVTPILFRSLGAEEYGIWSIVMALTGYYGLVNMGIGRANTKYIAQFHAVGDEQAVRRVMSTGMAIFLVLAAVVVALGVVVAWLFPVLFDVGDYSVLQLRWVVILTAAKVAIELISQVFGAGLVARKRFDLRNATTIGHMVLVAVATIVVMTHGGGLFELAVITLTGGILQALTTTAAALCVGLPMPARTAVCREAGRQLFSFGMLSLVVQVSRRVALFGGSLLLGLIVGPAAVAFYAVAESVTRKSVTLGLPFCGVMMPFASQFGADGNRRALTRLLVLPTRVLTAMAFLFVAVLVVMGKPFLSLWISQEAAENSYPIMAILSIALLAKLPANGIHSVLEGMGEMRFLSRVSIYEGFGVVVLGGILTALWGAVGMALAVVLAQTLCSGVCLPVYVCRRLNLGLARYVGESFGLALLAVVPAALLALYFVYVATANSLHLMLLQMSIVAATAVISALFLCIDAATRRAILASLSPWRGRRQGEGG